MFFFPSLLIKKVLFAVAAIFLVFLLPLSAEDEEIDDDFGALFEDASDVSGSVITEDKTAGTNYDVTLGSLKFPIEVSGKMNSELGLAWVKKGQENDGAGYFDFKNYIYFITRPDKYIALKGTMKTALPADDDEDARDNQSNYFYIYEIYFDYLMLDRIYITAGKKKTVWGNIRLFADYYDESTVGTSNDTEDGIDEEDTDKTDAQFTNILYDSREHLSGIVKIPIGNHTFTGVSMYKTGYGSDDAVGTKEMSFAASAEFVFFNTSINFFGRRFPLKTGEKAALHQESILGLELKRTILGFDLYGQGMGRVSDDETKSIKDCFTSKFDDLSSFTRIISTAGIYRMWADRAPYFGFNFEFQNIYRPEPDLKAGEKYFSNRFALYCGIAKLGPNKDLSVGVQWNHNIDERSGFIKPGVSVARVLPHCDWRIGAKYEYGLDEESNGFTKKLTVGTYITISMDY